METVRATAWFNDQQREGKDDPKWRGRIKIGTQVYYLDVWEKPDVNPHGPALLTLRLKPKKKGT